MSCFLLPRSFYDEIEGAINKFWWGHSNGRSKIHWLSWNKLCCPKKEGGLDFCNIHCFNLVMLAKQAWCILKNPSSLLAQLLKAKYFPTHILEASSSGGVSFSWHSIRTSRALIKKGVRWRIDDGQKVRIWDDGWLPNQSGFKPWTGRDKLRIDARVSELIAAPGSWNCSLIHATFTPHEANQILNIPLSHRQHQNKLIWHHTKKKRSFFYSKCILLGFVYTVPG